MTRKVLSRHVRGSPSTRFQVWEGGCRPIWLRSCRAVEEFALAGPETTNVDVRLRHPIGRREHGPLLPLTAQPARLSPASCQAQKRGHPASRLALRSGLEAREEQLQGGRTGERARGVASARRSRGNPRLGQHSYHSRRRPHRDELDPLLREARDVSVASLLRTETSPISRPGACGAPLKRVRRIVQATRTCPHSKPGRRSRTSAAL